MNKDTLLKELDSRIENIMSLSDWRKREAEYYLKSLKIYVSDQLTVESLMAGRLNSLITEIMNAGIRWKVSEAELNQLMKLREDISLQEGEI